MQHISGQEKARWVTRSGPKSNPLQGGEDTLMLLPLSFQGKSVKDAGLCRASLSLIGDLLCNRHAFSLISNADDAEAGHAILPGQFADGGAGFVLGQYPFALCFAGLGRTAQRLAFLFRSGQTGLSALYQ